MPLHFDKHGIVQQAEVDENLLQARIGLFALRSDGGYERMFGEMPADPDAMTGDATETLDIRHGIE